MAQAIISRSCLVDGSWDVRVEMLQRHFSKRLPRPASARLESSPMSHPEGLELACLAARSKAF